MVSPVTDPDLLRELEGNSAPVNDPSLIAELESPSNENGFMNTLSNAVSQTPLGMVSKGAESMSRGFGKLFESTSIPVPEKVQQGAKRLFSIPRAMGVGAATDISSRFTGGSPIETTERTMAALDPNFTPRNAVESVGSVIGENAPVVAAGMASPFLAGPAMTMAQQAQTGKSSPLPLLFPAAKGIQKSAQAMKLAERTVPPFLKSTKGIPAEVSKMALKDPSILEREGTSQSIQSKSQGIIDTIKEASRKIGREYRGAYADEGISSPVDDIILGNSKYKTIFNKNLEGLRKDYHAALSGELFNSKNVIGGTESISNKEKLEILTNLKRALQDKAIYPAAGQKLAPTQSAENAAIQKMAADIDNLRGTLPGGDKLAMADDAWAEMQELKGRLLSEFRDPYKGQDYLNKLLRGNVDWLTSGRNAGRVGAIERIEQITGKDVLKPALKEMAAAYLKNKDIMGLPSTRLEAILTSLIPTKMFFKSNPVKRMPFSEFSSTSRLFRESYEPGKRPADGPNNNGEQQNNQDSNSDGSKNLGEHDWTSLPQVKTLTNEKARQYLDQAKGEEGKYTEKETKVLSREKAREFLDEANGNKELARKLAREAGYTW